MKQEKENRGVFTLSINIEVEKTNDHAYNIPGFNKPNTVIIFRQIGPRNNWEAEWKKVRKKGIGGSDIGAIAGLSKWRGPIEVYMDKLGNLKERETSFQAKCGTELEGLIRSTISKRLKVEYGEDVEIREMPFTYRSNTAGDEFMLANVDGEINHLPYKDGPGLFEAKTASIYFSDEWDDGSVPMVYMAQIQWYMGIMGYKWSLIAYSVGNTEPEYTIIDFDKELFDQLKEIGRTFWNENILKEEVPPPFGTDSCQRMVMEIYPEIDRDTERELNDLSLVKLLEEREKASDLEKEYRKEKDRLTQEIELKLGDTGKVSCMDWKISYYETTRSTVDSKKLKSAHPEIFDKFSKQTTYRTLRPSRKKK